MVLDEKIWDEKRQFHPNLDESVPNRFTTGVDGAARTGCSAPMERAKTPRFGWSRLVVLAVEVGGRWSLTTRVCPLFARWSGISGIRSTV